MASDEQLVEKALRGDEAAFRSLVDRYQQKLLRFLRTRCASPADADDALQDAFLDAWRFLHTYSPRWRFSTWLYRIAIRRAHRNRRDTSVCADVVAVGDDPLARCIADNERENLWLLARRELSGEACTALWLRYVEDRSLKEIAMIMQKSLPWTKVTLMRARRKMKTALLASDGSSLTGNAYG